VIYFGERKTTGQVCLNFHADGNHDYAALYLRQVKTDEYYTLFLNPYAASVQVFSGEIYYDQTL